MKNLCLLLIAIFIFSLGSCEIIGGIFKARVGVGVILVVLVAALIIFLISKASGGKQVGRSLDKIYSCVILDNH